MAVSDAFQIKSNHAFRDVLHSHLKIEVTILEEVLRFVFLLISTLLFNKL